MPVPPPLAPNKSHAHPLPLALVRALDHFILLMTTIVIDSS